VKLTTKFTFIVLIAAAAAAGTVSLYVSHAVQSSLKTQIGERQLELAESVFSQVDTTLYERYLDIQSLSENELIEEYLANEVPEDDEKKIRQYLKEQTYLSGPWDAFFVVDEVGTMILSSDTKEEGEYIDTEPNNLIAYEAAMKGRVYYSDLVISDDTGRPTIIFAAPIRDEESEGKQIKGVIIGNYAWAAVVEIIKRINTEVHLVNSRGQLIADSGIVHEGELFEDLSSKELFKHAFEEEKGEYDLHPSTHGNFQVLAAHTHQKGYLGYEGSNWVITIEREADVAFVDAKKAAIETVIVLVPAIAVAAGVVLLLIIRFLTGPIESLIKITKAMAGGDLTKRVEVKSKDEIGQLASSFNEMTDKLQESYETLEQKVEDRTRELAIKNQAVESSLTAIGMTDLEGKVTYVNNAAVKMWGYDNQEEAIGKPLVDYFATDRPMTTMKNLKEKGFDSGEDIGKRKDGSTFNILFSANVIREEGGKPIAMLGAFMDITQRKKSENRIVELNEVLKILNKILRHDILNDLTVVGGNIDNYLQYGSKKVDVNETMKEAAEAIERDIAFIGQMKELEGAVSGGKELKPVKVQEVIQKVIGHFEDMKIASAGEATVLADEALDSVITNLVRNAKVHGGVDQVEISIVIDGDMVKVSVADQGKGIPDEVKKQLFQEGFKYGETGHSGLGLYIVRKTIERYGGTVSVEDNKPKGAVFVIKVPRVKE